MPQRLGRRWPGVWASWSSSSHYQYGRMDAGRRGETGTEIEILSVPLTPASIKNEEKERMSKFTPAEIEYLQSQRLGRLATVNEKGDPHVVPVGFRYNA